MHAEQDAGITAPIEKILTILRDYRGHHAEVLPRQYFTAYAVESGGAGAGTVFTATVSVMGQSTSFRMVVAEPEPGRIIEEADPESGTVTRFLLRPENAGAHTHVRITTDSPDKPGFAGWLDRTFTPGTMRRIYKAELANLQDYATKID